MPEDNFCNRNLIKAVCSPTSNLNGGPGIILERRNQYILEFDFIKMKSRWSGMENPKIASFLHLLNINSCDYSCKFLSKGNFKSVHSSIS